MLRSRLLWKIYAAFVALVLLATILVGTMITRQVTLDALAEIQSSLGARAILLKDIARAALQDPAGADAQAHVEALGGAIDTRLTILRADGRVIADSEQDPALMENHLNRPEILAARASGYGTITRYSNTVNARMVYVALPVESEGELLGFVRTSHSLAAVDKQVQRVRQTAAAGAALAILVALPLGFVFARRFTRPLASMTSVAEAIAEGQQGERLPTMGTDEIGKLARALNRMAHSSRQRMETIETDHSKLLTILAGMEEGVVAVDRQQRVVHMNAAAGRILRAALEQSIGQPIREVTRSTDVCDILERAVEQRAEIRAEYRAAARPRDHVVSLHASPLRDGEGNLAGAVVVLHDVSELHRLETVRRDFVANVSHELKTPITAIRGLVETLIDDCNMTPENRARFAAKIRDQSMRLSAIVTDLLTLSRMESGETVLEHHQVDLREVIDVAVQPFLSLAEQRGVSLRAELPEEPLVVRGDEEALRQATGNLLDNALKYTPSGGSVWVRLRRAGGKALLEVEDTGIGIEPRHQTRIFERFYRVDKARSRELGGTGLGLSIVKHIALAHEGEVSVESIPAAGTTFRIVLPLALKVRAASVP